jgi:hypothetical protein
MGFRRLFASPSWIILFNTKIEVEAQPSPNLIFMLRGLTPLSGHEGLIKIPYLKEVLDDVTQGQRDHKETQ